MAHVCWHPMTGELNIVTSDTAGEALPVAEPEVTDGDYECTVVHMEIIYAPETYYKTTTDLGNFNNTSIVSHLYDENCSALFSGDVGIEGSTIIENLYGRYIESDMCQISRNGVEDVPLSFYDKVNASILFYPCNRWLYDQTDRHYEERKEMERWDCTKEILIAELGQYVRAWGTTFDKDAELSIPDYN